MKYYLISIILIYITCPLCCVPVKNKNSKMKIILVEKDDLVIEELFHVNWDNTLVFQKILTSPPSTSALGNSYNEIKPIIAPYRFRVSEDGNKIAILSNDPKYQSDKDHNMEFILYDLKSKKLSKTKLPLNESPVGKVEVIDFMIMDNGMFYLLDRVYINEKTNTDRLRLIQPDGIVVWEVKCNNADDATFQNGAFIGKCTAVEGLESTRCVSSNSNESPATPKSSIARK